MRLCRGKRPRGARPSQVVVALFLALEMAQFAILGSGHGTGFLCFFRLQLKSMQSAA